MSNIKMEIPEYLSIKDWKYFNSLEHLSDTEKMITLISHLTNMEVDEVKKWKPKDIKNSYATLLEAFQDMKPNFFPVFELDGVLYGYTPMSKMTLGEYVDLERLAKKANDNLEEIIAILYRPITKNRFKGIKWAFKNSYKVALGEAENLFKYYEVEEYDSKKRNELADKLGKIPVSVGLGALGFFLAVGSSLLLNTQTSSLNPNQKMTVMKEAQKELDLVNIGDGLLQFIIYQKHPSFQSQDRKLSQSSISSFALTSWHMNKIKTKGLSRLENNKKELIKLDNDSNL